jgi:hypothetical protein
MNNGIASQSWYEFFPFSSKSVSETPTIRRALLAASISYRRSRNRAPSAILILESVYRHKEKN